jgi:BlaI family transcriptional regulator, penicillinase repressor
MINIPKIAESEWRIMKILWTNSPKTANEIVELLSKETKWNPRTTKTLLNRLVKKGALGFQKEGRTYLYFPLISKDECAKTERNSVLDRVYDGALKPLLVSFIEEENLTEEEIEELQKILNQKKGK